MSFSSFLSQFDGTTHPLKEANIELPFLSSHITPYLSARYPDLVADTELISHINVVSLGVLFYHTIYTVSKLPLMFSSSLQKVLVSRKEQVDFCVRITSFIQASLICALAIPLFGNEELSQHRVFSFTPYSQFYLDLALSYFIWDTLISTYFLDLFGIGFLIHGVVSTAVFSSAVVSRMINYYGPVFLLFEISTPFLNIRWFGLKFGHIIPDWIQLVNNVILLLIFFFVRICWGWYQVFRLAVDFYESANDERFVSWVAVLVLVCNFVLDVLNVYWFSKMMIVAVTTIKQMIGQTAKDKADAKLKLM